MATLQKKFYLSTKDVVAPRPDGVPNWYINDFQKQYWFGDKDNTNISFFYSKTADDVFVQYGQNVELWGTVKFLAQDVKIKSEKINSDNSIDGVITAQGLCFVSRKTDFAGVTGPRVVYKVTIGGKTVYSFDGTTLTEFTQGKSEAVDVNIHVGPEEEASSTAFKVEINYPGGEFPNTSYTVGYSIYNPLKKEYRPNFLVKNNKGLSLDLHNGKNLIYKDNKEIDISKENRSTAGSINSGRNRVGKDNVLRQAMAYLDNGTIP